MSEEEPFSRTANEATISGSGSGTGARGAEPHQAGSKMYDLNVQCLNGIKINILESRKS